MSDERIERALREGPPDEPVYRPGTFRKPMPGRWAQAASAGFLVLVFAVGVIFGAGIIGLRRPVDENTVPVGASAALTEALQGAWASEPIPREDWVQRLVGMGNAIDDVESFLTHDPMTTNVVYTIIFSDNTLLVTSSLDGAPRIHNSIGPFVIQPGGQLRWEDLGCFVTTPVTIDDGGDVDRLSFGPISMESCGADERVANGAFFNLSTFRRLP
jgi:hypothetical protein